MAARASMAANLAAWTDEVAVVAGGDAAALVAGVGVPGEVAVPAGAARPTLRPGVENVPAAVGCGPSFARQEKPAGGAWFAQHGAGAP